ncbi:MAG: hypothetical protein QNJ12_01610 [Ilumatobacter sp.]|uniref:hypothetical protein n=1 Tax=Ilumatobacter sp. TaxID=1967498 RepID=UPI0026175C38|nr:hypothetical protein [Ilumatobacter sp.]MDJ0767451.1 hypothetical protein [Ilumatobacter sp.]
MRGETEIRDAAAGDDAVGVWADLLDDVEVTLDLQARYLDAVGAGPGALGVPAPFRIPTDAPAPPPSVAPRIRRLLERNDALVTQARELADSSKPIARPVVPRPQRSSTGSKMIDLRA